MEYNLCRNEKGAIAYVSTLSPLVDLFGVSKTNFDGFTFEEFKNIFNMCYKAYLSDPNKYLSLLKYRRSPEKMGQKMIYYIMVSIIRLNNPERYKEVLEWTHSYKKDYLRLARIFSMSNMYFDEEESLYIDVSDLKGSNNLSNNTHFWLKNFNNVCPPELELLGDYIFSKLESGESDMCFKYIGTDHFSVENMIIKRYINKKYNKSYTNSQYRKMFSREKKRLHLVDELLKGFKDDGSRIVSGDEEYVANYLEKTSAQTFQRVKKTIEKFSESEEEYKKVLYESYKILLNRASNKELSVKTSGLSLVDECRKYSENNDIDSILEATLDKKFENLLEKLQTRQTISGIDVVVDNSGSMNGTPLNTACYIATFLVKLFNLDSLLFFNRSCKRVFIDSDEKTWHHTIKQVFTSVTGCTNLSSVFTHLTSNNNLTIILTDGDCDPSSNNTNPFRDALTLFPNRKFIVWNLKESALHFPYSVDDQRVGYISGNDPSVIECVFKALLKFDFNPVSILDSCIDGLECPIEIDARNKEFFEFELSNLYKGVMENLPPKNY